MARQKIEDNLFFVIFRSVPTWATLAIVIASYVVLRYLGPLLLSNNPWAQIGSTFAPYFTFLLALFALGAEWDKYKRRRLVSRQSSLNTLCAMTWQEFEQLVGEAYRRQGYSVEETGGGGPDGGVDIILRRSGETVLVQCKHWRNQSVGVKPLRELRGVVSNASATRGIFVTCGGYASAALRESGGRPSLELIDGSKLLSLVQGVQSRDSASKEVMPNAPTAARVNDTLTFSDAPEPMCPKCGSLMRKKLARQGVNTGKEFWGCPAFPKCRGTRDIMP